MTRRRYFELSISPTATSRSGSTGPASLCFLLSGLPGWWVKLTNDPGYDASTMLLLTDGRVMCQESGGVKWKALTPDQNGSYLNGTWSDLAPMHHTRRYYASAVLADGRVVVTGGEYSDAGSETNTTEIYDPVLDTWTEHVRAERMGIAWATQPAPSLPTGAC